MSVKNKIRNYFKLNNEQKDELLVEIINIYKEEIIQHRGMYSMKMLIDMDIQRFTLSEDYEMVQALTDIKNEINQIEEQIKKGNV